MRDRQSGLSRLRRPSALCGCWAAARYAEWFPGHCGGVPRGWRRTCSRCLYPLSRCPCSGVGIHHVGHIADLSSEVSYITELTERERWDERLFSLQSMKRRAAESPGASSGRRIIRGSLAAVAIPLMKVTQRFAIVKAKDEDLRVRELIHYLNRDTFYLTQGLASTVNQLYFSLVETDKEILSLRGEILGEDEGTAEEEAEAPAPTESPVLVGTAKESALDGLTRADGSIALLEKAEWRRDRLESATRVIISFRNQKLLEQRFHKLMIAIFFGGAVVALGAGAFAASPKLGKPQPILITQPTQVPHGYWK